VRQLLNFYSADTVFGHRLTGKYDTFFTDKANALIAMCLDDLPELCKILGRGHEPCLENGRWKLILLTIEASQWNLNEVFLVAFVHCGSEL
jgi:hypothetical protein